MSPTVFRERGYRFLFFSREETRMHVHVQCPEGEAKYWLEPNVALAENHRLSRSQLNDIEDLIETHYHELTDAWHRHFGR